MKKSKTKPKVVAPAPPVNERVPARVEGLAIASLLLLQFLFWWPAALLRGYYLVSDACFFFDPMKAFLHERLRAGHLALWSPYVLGGYPVGAEGQIATFYPPSLLFSWLLDGGGAVNWLLISHLMLAAVGMYLLAREVGVSPFGSWVAGVVFSFSGFLFAHLQHVSLICAAAWLPLLILFVDRAWSRKSPRYGAFAALTWGAMELAGHPQTLFYASLTVVFWAVWGALRERGAGGRWLRAAGLLAITFGLGVGVAAVQLLLTRDLAALAPHGERGTLAYVTSFSLLGKHLFGLVAPNWQGTPGFDSYHGERYYWEYVLYLGLLPFALALVGASVRRGWALAGLAVGALLLALAAGNPLWEALRYLPGFADFRVPARLILVFTFAAALLAGIGWDHVARWVPKHYLRLTPYLVAALILADVWAFDKSLSALTSAEAYHLQNRFVERLQSDGEWWRAEVVPPVAADADWKPEGGWVKNPDGWMQARSMLGADIPQAYRLRSMGGYVGFADPEHAAFMGAAQEALFQHRDVGFHSLLGARYLLLPPQYQLPIPRRDTPGFTVFRNPEAFPRAFGLGDVRVGRSRDETLLIARDLERTDQFRQVAAAYGSLGPRVPRKGAVVRVLGVEEVRPEHVRVTARADRDALLILNERWDPGWRVRVDGRATPLVEVDGFLMGTPLPAGEHVVEFRYEPRGLTIGLPITLASVAACLALVLWPAGRTRAAQV